MELIQFDGDYINTQYIVAILAPKENNTGKWEIVLKTDARLYPYYTWEFSSQFEADLEFKKLVNLYTGE
jgi:hypothetical protein